MPTLDPGFAHYMRRSARAKPPQIEAVEDGWVWKTADEVHLLTPFGAVHKYSREDYDA